ncbi:hypothetical protein IE81DRAFT_152194 [Ceraceosorus guamensis]|uniref:MT-A70-domain-containing protein n=1 Tax=Ceraceosorus guamensis TaxID=1522189 RepID=A0A316VWN5_9BASI|nr:hypothetical protein IE81DRAFT_152194 [Ceraceosorus guamensis]PWN41880.1 hypothetical protein IE81DRAFT_152194 [Ceraceosorus guamensis]
MAFEGARNEALARSPQHEFKSDPNDTSVVLHLERNTSRETAPADQIEMYVVDSARPFLDTLPAGTRLWLPRHPPTEQFNVESCAKPFSQTASNTKHAAPRKKRKLDASTIDLFSDIGGECLEQVRIHVTQGSRNENPWSLNRHIRVDLPRSAECDERGALPVAAFGRDKAGQAVIDWPAIEQRQCDASSRQFQHALHAKSRSVPQASDQVPSGTGTAAYTLSLAHRLVLNESSSHAEELAIATTDVPDGEPSEQGETRQPTLLMPCHSGFLLTDLLKSQLTLPSGFPEVLQFLHTRQLSLLLLDPPYPNASVARASKRNKHKEAYSPVQDLYDLWKLRDCVARLLKAGSAERSLAQNAGLNSHYAKERATLVACWVTNDPKARHLMLGKLFKSWDVVPIGEIGWLKVTASSASEDTSDPASGTNRRLPSDNLASRQDDNGCVSQGGQLVISPELALQTGRKSHEVLLLGRYVGAADSQSVDARARRMELARAEARECAQRRTVIVSVPLGHSRKPYVFDVLRPLLPPHRHQDSPVVVELFARNLCAGPVWRSDVHESIDGLLNAVSEPDVNTKGRARDELRPGAEAAVPSGTVQSRSLQRGWWISIGNEAPRFNIVGAGSPGLSRTAR